MEKFTQHLKANGINWHTAIQYSRLASQYLKWVKEKGYTAASVKRSQFTGWLETLRAEGNKDSTVNAKESVVKMYYQFKGYRNNPAVTWIRKSRKHLIPPPAIEIADLAKIYDSLKPNSPSDYRNRCMLGMVLFQGLTRSELGALRLQHVDFEKNGTVFIEEMNRRNSRVLQLETKQMIHLHEYVTRFRHDFVAIKTDTHTDKLFLSKGEGSRLDNSVTRLLYFLKRDYPAIKSLYHIRQSLISHWVKKNGLMEALTWAGMRYVSSVQPYQQNDYDELEKLLQAAHPIESMITTPAP